MGGDVDLVRGGVDSRGSYVSKTLYVETKESGPPRSANGEGQLVQNITFGGKMHRHTYVKSSFEIVCPLDKIKVLTLFAKTPN